MTGQSMYSSNILTFNTWKPGDVNGDWNVNILDITCLINYIYNDGQPPDPLSNGDINGDCKINLLDISYLINYLYKSGPVPQVGCE
jgi:hypothetical protein